MVCRFDVHYYDGSKQQTVGQAAVFAPVTPGWRQRADTCAVMTRVVFMYDSNLVVPLTNPLPAAAVQRLLAKPSAFASTLYFNTAQKLQSLGMTIADATKQWPACLGKLSEETLRDQHRPFSVAANADSCRQAKGEPNSNILVMHNLLPGEATLTKAIRATTSDPSKVAAIAAAERADLCRMLQRFAVRLQTLAHTIAVSVGTLHHSQLLYKAGTDLRIALMPQDAMRHARVEDAVAATATTLTVLLKGIRTTVPAFDWDGGLRDGMPLAEVIELLGRCAHSPAVDGGGSSSTSSTTTSIFVDPVRPMLGGRVQTDPLAFQMASADVRSPFCDQSLLLVASAHFVPLEPDSDARDTQQPPPRGGSLASIYYGGVYGVTSLRSRAAALAMAQDELTGTEGL